MKQVSCSFCGVPFEATRSDAKRCSDCRKKYLQEYRKRTDVRQRRSEQYRKVREELVEGYGGKCTCCGEFRFEFLALDHVNGGGRKERETLSTQQIAKKAIKQGFPDTYRILCHNCNQAHGWYGYCPHQKENVK